MSEVSIDSLDFDEHNLGIEVNRVRVKRGLSLLKVDSYLLTAAQGHVADMAINNFVSHIGSDGSSYIDRVRRLGSDIPPSGEIICKGPGGKNRIENVVQGWINSPGHAAILFDPNQEYMGIACHLRTEKIPGNYWLVNFSYRACGKVYGTLVEPLIFENENG